MINVHTCNGAINLLNYVVSISNTPFLDKIITPVDDLNEKECYKRSIVFSIASPTPPTGREGSDPSWLVGEGGGELPPPRPPATRAPPLMRGDPSGTVGRDRFP